MARAQIGRGSGGNDVKYLQEFLNTQGYHLDVDGVFGPQTESILQDFQSKNGLDADGIAGPNTWGVIDKYAQNSGSTNNNTGNSTNNNTNSGGSENNTTSNNGYTPSDVVTGAMDAINAHMGTKPTYTSQYMDLMKGVLDSINSREDFSYNFNEDALYQQYKDQYMKQGKMAMQDTMGQAAAMTGGYGNSYAQSVGQQAYNAQLEELNDVIPELYQMALNKYQMEGDELYKQFAMYGDMESLEYGRYRDEFGDWQNELDRLEGRYDAEWNRDYGKYIDDRNFEYQKESDDRAYEYQEGRDKVEDERWQKEYDAVYGNNGTTGGTVSTGSTGGNNSTGNTAYAGNQGISEANIKKMQNAIGVTADGKWGSASTEAAGGLSATEAWKAYQNGTLKKKTNEPSKSDYADWDALDWESYFAQIRINEGQSAAEEELSYFTSKGLIPTKYVSAGASGARGGKMGH